MNETQMAEVSRLKAYFPYRIAYGAIAPNGEFESGAVTTKRIPNRLARDGWTVWIVQ